MKRKQSSKEYFDFIKHRGEENEEEVPEGEPECFYYHRCIDCDMEISLAESRKYGGLCQRCATESRLK